MAMDTTPRCWPLEQRGLLDDLAGIMRNLIAWALGILKRRRGLATACGWATRKA